MIEYRLVTLMREYEQKKAMKSGSLTYRKLAKLTGLSPDTLNRIANNKVTRIDHHTLETLCAFFECQVQDLIVIQ